MAKDKQAILAKSSKRSLLKFKKKLKGGGRSSEASEVNDLLSRSGYKKVDKAAQVSKKSAKFKRKKQKRQDKGSPEKANGEKASIEAGNDLKILEGFNLSAATHLVVGKGVKDTETLSEISASHGIEEEETGKRVKTKKKTKARKSTKNDVHLSQKKGGLDEHPIEVDDEENGFFNYKETRPGLKILQQQIDEFIVSYEEQQEQKRKEREERAAEGGWTVVVHHKGRKKTTDAESGITVGSVAQAAVLDNMSKKKTKEVPIDFYRFQRREAQRNGYGQTTKADGMGWRGETQTFDIDIVDVA